MPERLKLMVNFGSCEPLRNTVLVRHKPSSQESKDASSADSVDGTAEYGVI
jgi:hypothetical protein